MLYLNPDTQNFHKKYAGLLRKSTRKFPSTLKNINYISLIYFILTNFLFQVWSLPISYVALHTLFSMVTILKLRLGIFNHTVRSSHAMVGII